MSLLCFALFVILVANFLSKFSSTREASIVAHAYTRHVSPPQREENKERKSCTITSTP